MLKPIKNQVLDLFHITYKDRILQKASVNLRRQYF